MSGNDGKDRAYGEDGNDVIDGGAGADWLFGGPGEDVIYGASGNDTIDTGEDDVADEVRCAPASTRCTRARGTVRPMQ